MITDFIPERAFFNRNDLTEYTVPDGVRTIGSSAFRNCMRLKSIRMPDSVTEIGMRAFSGCCDLESVILPEKLNGISRGLFQNCLNLKKIRIPPHVRSIGTFAFYGCPQLEEINIPASVDEIGQSAFSATAWLRKKQAEFPVLVINNTLISVDENTHSITIPDNVREIHQSAFQPFSAHLDFVSYRGITLTWQLKKGIPVYEIVNMICEKRFDFNYGLIPVWAQENAPIVQSDLLFRIFFAHPEYRELLSYIRRNLRGMFAALVPENQEELTRIILDSGLFVNKENIDMLISDAIDHQKIDVQLMLTDYKYQHIGFDSDEEIIRKKFEL